MLLVPLFEEKGLEFAVQDDSGAEAFVPRGSVIVGGGRPVGVLELVHEGHGVFAEVCEGEMSIESFAAAGCVHESDDLAEFL
jgi:hypothetical protein